MEHWKVLDKRQEKDRSNGTILILVCERAGKTRNAVVSGVTWDAAVVGEHVKLSPIIERAP